MSFFNTSDGEVIEADGEFDAGGDMEVIPAKTKLKAIIDDAKWAEYEGERYINVRWSIIQPDEYKNRKVFQKIRVLDGDSKKADKAKRMLAAIDTNAGGKLIKLGKIPSDEDLQINLLNKPMIIQVMVWEIDDRKGNWINSVSSAKKKVVEEEIEF